MPVPSSVGDYLKKILQGSAWVLVARVVQMGSGLLLSVAIARLLNPSEFGAYVLALSICNFLTIAAGLGVPRMVVRLVAESLAGKKPGEAASLAWSSILLVGTAAVLMAVLVLSRQGGVFLDWAFGSKTLVSLAPLLAAFLVLRAFEDVSSEIQRGYSKFLLASVYQGTLRTAISVIVIGGFWVIDKGTIDASGVMLILVLSAAITAFIQFFHLLHQTKSHFRRFAPKFRRVLGVSWPLLITQILLILPSQGMIWIVGFFSPESDVALFGAAIRLVVLLTVPLSIANSVLPPIISELYTIKELLVLERVVRKTAFFVAIPTSLAMLVVVLFSDDVMGKVYGEFYMAAGTVFLICSIGQFLGVVSGPCQQVLMMTGNERILLKITGVSAFVTGLSSVVLIGRYSVVGAAFATTVHFLVFNVLSVLAVRQKLGFWTLPSI